MSPRISVIVPCYNEEATIQQLLEAIYRQSYPRNEMEVLIADGLSQDDTLGRIEEFRNSHPDLDIRIVSNTERTIPSGLNCAIREARGEFLVRMDAHSKPFPDYIERCARALEADLGDNVGGRWKIEPGDQSWVARSIAIAAAHPLGVGDARYRIGTEASLVDTVPFGAFRKSLVEHIGLFDENLLTNEDYEFNARIRQSGRRIWFDPEIVTVYYSRASFRDLARQYWRYGFWKYRMLRRYPETLRWRQALPPLFVLSLFLLALLAWIPVVCLLLAVEVAVYASVLLLAGLHASWKHASFLDIVGVPAAIATMHIAWGAGFLASIFKTGTGTPVDG
jgi:succinoglycan biosynthesis protein ExoA